MVGEIVRSHARRVRAGDAIITESVVRTEAGEVTVRQLGGTVDGIAMMQSHAPPLVTVGDRVELTTRVGRDLRGRASLHRREGYRARLAAAACSIRTETCLLAPAGLAAAGLAQRRIAARGRLRRASCFRAPSVSCARTQLRQQPAKVVVEAIGGNQKPVASPPAASQRVSVGSLAVARCAPASLSLPYKRAWRDCSIRLSSLSVPKTNSLGCWTTLRTKGLCSENLCCHSWTVETVGLIGRIRIFSAFCSAP